MPMDRRTLVVALAAALVPGGAAAIRIEEMDAPRRDLILGACETRAAHAKVIADLVRAIESEGATPEAARLKARAMDCPFCGCGLAAFATLPDEGAAPKF